MEMKTEKGRGKDSTWIRQCEWRVPVMYGIILHDVHKMCGGVLKIMHKCHTNCYDFMHMYKLFEQLAV